MGIIGFLIVIACIFIFVYTHYDPTEEQRKERDRADQAFFGSPRG